MSDRIYGTGDIFIHRNGDGKHCLMIMKSNGNLCLEFEEVMNRQWSNKNYHPDKDTFTGLNIKDIKEDAVSKATEKQGYKL